MTLNLWKSTPANAQSASVLPCPVSQNQEGLCPEAECWPSLWPLPSPLWSRGKDLCSIRHRARPLKHPTDCGRFSRGKQKMVIVLFADEVLEVWRLGGTSVRGVVGSWSLSLHPWARYLGTCPPPRQLRSDPVLSADLPERGRSQMSPIP